MKKSGRGDSYNVVSPKEEKIKSGKKLDISRAHKRGEPVYKGLRRKWEEGTGQRPLKYVGGTIS